MVAGITTTAVELSSGGETGSVPNTAGASGDLQTGSRTAGGGKEGTKKKRHS